jgi:Cu+-exporting ATPase
MADQARVHAELTVIGMSCPGSEAVVLERRLGRLRGVTAAAVSGMTERAHVTFDPRLMTADEIAAAIRAAGYRVCAVVENRGPAASSARRVTETDG